MFPAEILVNSEKSGTCSHQLATGELTSILAMAVMTAH